MSLGAFQQAVAAMIRLAPHFRLEDIEPEFGELSEQERQSLAILAADKELNKYGEEQRRQRWQYTWNKLHYVAAMAGEELLYEIWEELFEPQHLTTKSDVGSAHASYTLAFMDFLAADSEARTRLDEFVPHHFYAVLQFERSQIELSQPLVRSPTLLADSCLTHGDIRVMTLDFDVITWIEHFMELDPEAPLPDAERRPEHVLLARTGAGSLPRAFEIDADVLAYVRSQWDEARTLPLTESIRADLQAMGLYREETDGQSR